MICPELKFEFEIENIAYLPNLHIGWILLKTKTTLFFEP